MAVDRRRRPCVRARSPARPPARASPSNDPGAQQDPFPAILPVVRFGLPNLGYPDPACRTAAAAPAALPWDRRASRTAGGTVRAGGPPGQQGKGSSVSASQIAVLGAFAGLTIF